MLAKIKYYWFYGLLIVSTAVTAVGYFAWQVDPPLVGMVESKFHTLSARDDGVVQQLLVQAGSTVSNGQLLGMLADDDLRAQRSQLQSELRVFEELLQADRQRYALEYHSQKLQISRHAAALTRQLAEMHANVSELNSLTQAVERLRRAEHAGLGRSRNLTELQVRLNKMETLVLKQSRPRKLEGQLHIADKELHEQPQQERVVASLMGRRLERLYRIMFQLVELEQRMKMRRVHAPCDGVVVEVYAAAGDTLKAFAPLIKIEDAAVSYVDAYIPETVDTTVAVGSPMLVYSKRSAQFNTFGTVAFIHPGYAPIPQRLMFRGQISWARKFRLRLDDQHKLLPGESVRVMQGVSFSLNSLAKAATTHSTLTKNAQKNAASKTARESKKVGPHATSRTRPIMGPKKLPTAATAVTLKPAQALYIPSSLRAQSRFEPSGLIWLEDIQRYLVVSDDTGFKDSSEHKPWLFLMDAQGQVEPEPIPVQGQDSLNDLEAVTAMDDAHLLLMSSQNTSKKGKRRANRQYLIKVRRQGRSFLALERIEFFSLLINSYSQAQLLELGLSQTGADGRPLLNIEGAAYKDGSLYLGLKQPISAQGAVIWQLKDIEDLFKGGSLQPGQLSLWGYADFSAQLGSPAGISDLLFHRNVLLALSTVPLVSTAEQIGGMHQLQKTNGSPLKVITLGAFPHLKPEGIAVKGNAYSIVFDRGHQTPSMQRVEYRP